MFRCHKKGGRVKCPCFHGDGCPRNPQRRQKGQRTWATAQGPAVALATSASGWSEILHSQEEEEEEGVGGGEASWEDPSAFILKEEEEEEKS